MELRDAPPLGLRELLFIVLRIDIHCS